MMKAPIKIRNRPYYRLHYGIVDSRSRLADWRKLKRFLARTWAASIVIDDHLIQFHRHDGDFRMKAEVLEWLYENVGDHFDINCFAMMIFFADVDDMLAFQLRFS